MDQVATRKRRCRSASEWRSIMARQEASGLSGEGFCEAEGIGRSAFWRWRRRLSDEAAAGDGGGAAFVELSAARPASWDVELELGAGVVLRVRRPAC